MIPSNHLLSSQHANCLKGIRKDLFFTQISRYVEHRFDFTFTQLLGSVYLYFSPSFFFPSLSESIVCSILFSSSSLPNSFPLGDWLTFRHNACQLTCHSAILLFQIPLVIRLISSQQSLTRKHLQTARHVFRPHPGTDEESGSSMALHGIRTKGISLSTLVPRCSFGPFTFSRSPALPGFSLWNTIFQQCRKIP